jgi:hypothetical protein
LNARPPTPKASLLSLSNRYSAMSLPFRLWRRWKSYTELLPNAANCTPSCAGRNLRQVWCNACGLLFCSTRESASHPSRLQPTFVRSHPHCHGRRDWERTRSGNGHQNNRQPEGASPGIHLYGVRLQHGPHPAWRRHTNLPIPLRQRDPASIVVRKGDLQHRWDRCTSSLSRCSDSIRRPRPSQRGAHTTSAASRDRFDCNGRRPTFPSSSDQHSINRARSGR